MKTMKFIAVVFLAIVSAQCASVQFETQPPFTVTKATYTNWVGGIEGVSGFNVNMDYTAANKVEFDSIFFRGRIAKVSYKETGDSKSILGYFSTSTRQEQMSLNREASKEYGNSSSVTTEPEFPFELKDNEAVVSYRDGDQLKYYKLENLQEGKKVFMQ